MCYLTNVSEQNITKRDLPTGVLLLFFFMLITSVFTNRYILVFDTLPLSHYSWQNCTIRKIWIISRLLVYISHFFVLYLPSKNVCVLQWTPLFLPVDVQNTPCPCWFFILQPRGIQAMPSLRNILTKPNSVKGVHDAISCHRIGFDNIRTPATQINTNGWVVGLLDMWSTACVCGVWVN